MKKKSHSITQVLKLPSEINIQDPATGLTWERSAKGEFTRMGSVQIPGPTGMVSAPQTLTAQGDELARLNQEHQRHVQTNRQFGAALVAQQYEQMQRQEQQQQQQERQPQTAAPQRHSLNVPAAATHLEAETAARQRQYAASSYQTSSGAADLPPQGPAQAQPRTAEQAFNDIMVFSAETHRQLAMAERVQWQDVPQRRVAQAPIHGLGFGMGAGGARQQGHDEERVAHSERRAPDASRLAASAQGAPDPVFSLHDQAVRHDLAAAAPNKLQAETAARPGEYGASSYQNESVATVQPTAHALQAAHTGAPSDPRDAGHPDHAMNEGVRGHLQALHAEHGIRVSPEQLDNVTAAVMLSARESRMTQVTHMYFSVHDDGQADPSRIILYQGEPRNAASKINATQTTQAVSTPAEQSYEQFETTKQQQLAQDQQWRQQQATLEQSQGQGMRMSLG